MTKLDADLAKLQSALSILAAACIANGDTVDHQRVVLASAQVSAAAFQSAAADIVATLPEDSDGDKIQAMLGNMADAAQAINAKRKSITDAVEIATGFANVVIDVSAGNIAGAASAALGLQSFLR